MKVWKLSRKWALKMRPDPKITIILLTYKRTDLLDARLKELHGYYNKREDVQVLVIDNGSPGISSSSIMQGYLMKGDKWFFSVHRIPENIGFGPAMNKGVEEAKGEIVCLLSDDVRIYGDFVSRVIAMMEVMPDSILAAEIVNWPAGWNQFGATPTFPYLQGYFLAMKKETFNKVGGFDERFAPYDYEDVDFSYTAQKLKLSLKQIALPLEHLAAGTIGYSDERMDHTCRMRALFAEKWGLPNEPKRP